MVALDKVLESEKQKLCEIGFVLFSFGVFYCVS